MKAIEELGGLTAFRIGTGEPAFSLQPDPRPQPIRYTIVSVDDHLVEPPDCFTTRVPARFAESAPRVVEADDGREYWLIDGNRELNVGGNAAVGQGPEAPIAGVSMRFDEMRPGVWDIHARVRDMDLMGVVASLGFPSMVFGFCGQRFLRMRDRELGVACMRAYNDWVIDTWAAPYPERIIPCQLTWLADVDEAIREIERNAARGFKAVSFSENPEKLGLPSIHTGYWDPFLAACQATQTVVNLHVGSSSQVCHPSSDAPAETMSALFAVNSLLATVDWLYSGIPSRFPELRIVLSEGGIGWVPMLLDRLDYLTAFPRTRDWTDTGATPSEVLSRSFWFASFSDPSMWALRDRIGLDHIVLETDYPHPDTTWPDTQRYLHEHLRDLPPGDVAKLTHTNAARLYRHTLPTGTGTLFRAEADALVTINDDVERVEYVQFDNPVDRAEPQPCYRSLIEQGGFLEPMPGLVMSFDRDVSEFVLRHHELFSNTFTLNLGNPRPLIPINVDPPMHSRYRKLLDPLFSPKRMDELDDDIARRANGFIDLFVDRGECNFTEEYAELFPSSVFLDLLGLPQEDLSELLRLRDGVLHAQRVDPAASTDAERRRAVMDETGLEILRYFGDLVDSRRVNPTDDIVSRFLAVSVDGDELSRDEIVDIGYQLLIAGLDTVSDTLTCFYAFLATHPEHRAQLVADPSLIPAAVEELLRWETPVFNTVRRVVAPEVELPNGCPVTKDTIVMVSYGAANVDPKVYPDGFDVRFDRVPNPHLAFGGGVHRCLGSHLARRELRVTLREWHRRIPSYRLKPGHEDLEYPPLLRHVKDLTLAWP